MHLPEARTFKLFNTLNQAVNLTTFTLLIDLTSKIMSKSWSTGSPEGPGDAKGASGDLGRSLRGFQEALFLQFQRLLGSPGRSRVSQEAILHGIYRCFERSAKCVEIVVWLVVVSSAMQRMAIL